MHSHSATISVVVSENIQICHVRLTCANDETDRQMTLKANVPLLENIPLDTEPEQFLLHVLAAMALGTDRMTTTSVEYGPSEVEANDER